MNKTDRILIIFSAGMLIASFVYVLSSTHRKSVQKNNVILEERQEDANEIFNIHVWKTYHEREMELMRQILEELRKQNNNQQPVPVEHL